MQPSASVTSPPGIAARIERLPLSGFHRRFVALLALGGWFDFYDIFMMAYLGAALQTAGFLSLQEFSHVIAAGFLGMFIGTVSFGLVSVDRVEAKHQPWLALRLGSEARDRVNAYALRALR